MSNIAEQVKERLDIVELLGSYLKLEKAGQNFKARCPFHNEKSASFFVSPSRQSFYCFGCQAKGDIFSFVERFEGLDFRGALKMLAEKAGVKMEDFAPEEQDKREILFRIVEEATTLFESSLQAENIESKKALEYILSRGITLESLKKWRIGFAPEEWRKLHDALLAKGFTKEDMIAAGVIKNSEGKFYDTFRNRIMFPISDQLGRIIAFSGRSMDSNPNTPKYLNSPETPLFKKSEVLYGLHFAKGAIRTNDYSVLVEGQMDLVLSDQAGVTNSIASSGTALTDLHLRRLQKISNRIILAYDGDEAGQKAAKRSLELGLLLGMEVKMAALPLGEDPASVVQRSPLEWKEIVRSAKEGIIAIFNLVQKQGLSGINLAKKINTEVLPLIALISDEMVKSQYVALMSKQSGIPETAIKLELSKQKTPEKVLSSFRETSSPLVENSMFSPEEMLVGLCLWQMAEGNTEWALETQKRFGDLLGENIFSDIAENGKVEKETLIFEAERSVLSLEASLDFKRMAEELFTRLEKKVLQREFEQLASRLDGEEREDEKEKILLTMGEISKKLSILSI